MGAVDGRLKYWKQSLSRKKSLHDALREVGDAGMQDIYNNEWLIDKKNKKKQRKREEKVIIWC